ncbi:MAG: hypothetical protein A2144_11685 [Chloroflexi bacterium RBG_16_50_9]|nr:MAG: hypothetical protein A2144_11685 [Chloroflexi bacterium RBG_16_50_9]
MNQLSSRLTPINDLDISCDRAEATFCIYNIDPEFVTKKLNVMPTSSQKIGISRIMPSGKKRIGKVDSWLLSSEASHVSSKDIRTHLDWLLDKVKNAAAPIKELQEMPNAKMSIQCTWWSADGGGGPTLWPEQMKRMAKLNLECGFNFAYYGND